jgi:aminoglycoside phosphotransferase family enzyme
MTAISDIVAVLSNPDVYPETTRKVQVAQTQMSVVFLIDTFVYKIKKPVNLGYLDYTTLEKRHHLCEQEVKLNRRLCPEVYLGVVPITLDRGKIILDGKGEAIEYAVKMRKLPYNRMMDVLLVKNRVTPAMMVRVAEKVANFHRNAETSPDIGKFGSLETIIFNTEENFSQTEKYVGRAFSQEQYNRLVQYTRDFIKNKAVLFNKRVSAGKIKDCHGDLHAQHICFTDGICIYDCIEFNDRFRYVDVAAEVSFLAMDLDRWGHPELSNYFVNGYIAMSGDNEISALLNFYKCYFAYVRAKVNCFRLDDVLLSMAEKVKALADARLYFSLAESYRMRDES